MIFNSFKESLLSTFQKILKHKKKHRNKYVWKVNHNNLGGTKRPKIQTEKYENLTELCKAYDRFSGRNEKKIL